MEPLYKKYIEETLDENGLLKAVKFHVPDNFNFGYDVVDEIAKKSPDKRALLWVSNKHEVKDFSFKDISLLSNKVANYLVSKGIKRGDRVLLVLKRSYEFWLVSVALHKIGAVMISATHQLKTKDLLYRYEKAGIRGIICTVDDGFHLMAQEALSLYNGEVAVKMTIKKKIEGFDFFDDEIYKQSDRFDRVETYKDDNMVMFFTSGTSGYPKLATHAFDYPIGHITTAVWWHEVDPQGLHLTIADTGWAKAVWGKLYGQWLAEAAVFVYDFDRFKAEDIMPLFAQFGITSLCAPPTMYRMLIKEDLNKYDLSSIKHATIAGEALNPEVFKQFMAATGLKLMEGFGQTETTLSIANFVGMEPKVGSMGKPNPQYDIALVDENGKDVLTGAVGEIVIRTDNGRPVGLFKGYFNDPERTKEVWDNGIYHTGDTAWRDEDGYFWYVSRNDDVIKSSGYRIGPFEVESVIMEFPGVLECAVIGAPDPKGERGNVVMAIIVLKGVEPSEELKKKIQDYVKSRTAPYKYPRIIEFVSELPKTTNGKIKRNDLRDMLKK